MSLGLSEGELYLNDQTWFWSVGLQGLLVNAVTIAFAVLFTLISWTTLFVVQLQISFALSPSMLFPMPPFQFTKRPHDRRWASSSEANVSTCEMRVNISIAYFEKEEALWKYDGSRVLLMLCLSPSPSAQLSLSCIKKYHLQAIISGKKIQIHHVCLVFATQQTSWSIVKINMQICDELCLI